MDHHHKKEEDPFYVYPFDDSTMNRAYAAATGFFSFLGDWAILVATCTIALFFLPLSPAFTLQSASASVLNVTGGNHLTANLGVEFLVDDFNPVGSSVDYDSLRVSLFHRKEMLSSFSLPGSFKQDELTKTPIRATFPNVSVELDEWGGGHRGVVQVHGPSCGFVYLDLWFSASARFTQPMWPARRDRLQGHCGEVKVELCSSGPGTIVHSLLASCNVHSDVVRKFRLVLFALLILFLGTSVAVPFLVEHFFC